MENSEVNQPALKVISAWVGVGAGLTLDQLASLAALIYTLCLIGEWAWKKAIALGWLKPRSKAE